MDVSQQYVRRCAKRYSAEQLQQPEEQHVLTVCQQALSQVPFNFKALAEVGQFPDRIIKDLHLAQQDILARARAQTLEAEKKLAQASARDREREQAHHDRLVTVARLRKACDSAGLSIPALADASGVSVATIKQLRSTAPGVKLRIDRYAADLARVLHVSAQFLMGG